ncbi:hypothetical protein CEP51_011918 [Fusarium floridanum]|uniref:Heterokaryon incompatibility domain-containing protein n=1 Tax=Fusarium floridanum TaxID=1325733 RepID=A0A428R3T5_9HYPO|nr:hypothetical protein CEP51_011918 [Fusarium floridanum]
MAIEPVFLHTRFSEQVPFRFLRPSTGGTGNPRKGRAVGILDENTSYCRKIQSRSIWSQHDYSLEERLHTIQDWLKECNEHEACKRTALDLPKRVIDVFSMVLYESSENETGRYAALSYCWGRDSLGNDILTFKTTADTLDDRKKSLCLEGETMHKTFADAIAITRGLGIRYLWIDSLCIVQSDDGEFESEAGKMAAYYENAELTLAATDSVDCEGGMLYPSHLRRTFNVTRFAHQGKGAYAFLESIQTDLESEINSAPLNQRGWALQEGILSRRMIHFAKRQLIWECKTKVASEDGLVVLKKHRIIRPFALPTLWLPPASRYEEWDAVVQDYSSRQLSKTKDKILALAGATTRFMHLLRDEPLLGLWREDLRAGLLWRTTEPRDRVKAVELKSIPSWSWMVVDGPITFDTKDRSYFRGSWVFKIGMKIDEASVRWKGEELTSEVEQTRLVVSGVLIPFNPSLTTIKDIWWDSPSRPNGDMFLLLVGQARNWSKRSWDPLLIGGSKDYFLVLSQTAQKMEYSRVGMGALDNGPQSRGDFADQSQKTIVLV